MSKTATIGALLEVATPVQCARVRAHLEKQEGEWDTDLTPMEHAIAMRALQAFDAGDYSNEAVAKYMTPDVVEKIFG